MCSKFSYFRGGGPHIYQNASLKGCAFQFLIWGFLTLLTLLLLFSLIEDIFSWGRSYSEGDFILWNDKITLLYFHDKFKSLSVLILVQ